jgi:hypothetical protein
MKTLFIDEDEPQKVSKNYVEVGNRNWHNKPNTV